MSEGSFCLLEEGNLERAHALAGDGIRVARAIGNLDLEMLGRAVQGLALVASGAVAEGMRGLDEVNTAVVAGELTDLVSIGDVVLLHARRLRARPRLRPRGPVVHAAQGLLREVGAAPVVRRLPHAVRVDLPVARRVGRSRTGAERGEPGARG